MNVCRACRAERHERCGEPDQNKHPRRSIACSCICPSPWREGDPVTDAALNQAVAIIFSELSESVDVVSVDLGGPPTNRHIVVTVGPGSFSLPTVPDHLPQVKIELTIVALSPDKSPMEEASATEEAVKSGRLKYVAVDRSYAYIIAEGVTNPREVLCVRADGGIPRNLKPGSPVRYVLKAEHPLHARLVN